MTLDCYVGCRRVVFVAQMATFCVVSATCRDTSLVTSQTQENVVSARVSKRHGHVVVNFIEPNFQDIIFILSTVSLITQK